MDFSGFQGLDAGSRLLAAVGNRIHVPKDPLSAAQSGAGPSPRCPVNENFLKDNPDLGWDWSKTDKDSYDIQMFGVTQSSTQAAIKKIRKELKKSGYAFDKSDMNTFGTQAVIAYLASIETK